MSRPKRQLVILAALAASYVLGTVVAEFAVQSTRPTHHTDHAPATEVPVNSVVSSTVESMAPTIPEP